MKTLILQLLSDDAGNVSSTRASLILTLLTTLVPWAIISMQHGQLAEIPDHSFQLIVTLITAKTVQKFGETKPPTPPQS